MTKINVRIETTINTGNFNNVKLDYGIEDEVRDGESANAAFTRIKSFVEDRIITDAAEVSEDWAELRKKKA
jgi:hypothetical protein